MTKTKLAIAGVMTTVVLLGVGVGAHAQNAAQNPERAAPAAQRGFDPAATKARMEDRHAARAAALHDILAITPAQEGAWSAYQAAIRPPLRQDRQRGLQSRDGVQGLTTPERLDRMVEHANARHAEMLARANATRAFYNQLSAVQKKAFDALPQAGGGRHVGRGGPGVDGRMGPGPRGGRGFGEGRGPVGARGDRPAPAN